MSELDSKSIIEGNTLSRNSKGALTEQYACQELIASCGLVPYYWSAENSREKWTSSCSRPVPFTPSR